MPFIDPVDAGGPPPPFGGGGGQGYAGLPGGGTTSLPGTSYASPTGARFQRPMDMGVVLARRRRMLMGGGGAQPAGAFNPYGNNQSQPPNVSGTGTSDAFGRSQAYSPGSPYDPYANDPRSNLSGMDNRIIGAGGNAGAFDPMGSASMMQALSQKLGMESAGRQAQAGTAARYFAGDDPAAAGYASLASQLNGQSSDAAALNDARLQNMLRVQDWIRSMVGHNAGAGDEAANMVLQRRLMPQPQGPGIGGALGTIAGTALGGWLSPGGLWGGSGR